MTLSTIASEQLKATKTTLKNVHQVLYYLATNPDVTIRVYVSEMILNINSDAFYMYAKNAKSCASGHLFLGPVTKDGEPTTLNGAIHTLYKILKCVS